MGTFEIGLNVFCLMIKQQVMGTWEENVVLGMRMTSIGSYICMLNLKLMSVLGMIRWHDLAGEVV